MEGVYAMGVQVNGFPQKAIEIISDVANKYGIINRVELVDAVCKELETMWREDCWEERAQEIQLGTTGQISYAFDLYYAAEVNSSMAEKLCPSVSEGALRLVGEAVRTVGSVDRIRLLEAICDVLERKFQGKTLEYHLKQMNLRTTKDILYAIDIYKIGLEFKIFDLSA